MKTPSLLAVLPIIGVLSMSTDHAASTCSVSNFGISPVPCGKRYAVSYEAYRKYVIKHGASPAEILLVLHQAKATPNSRYFLREAFRRHGQFLELPPASSSCLQISRRATVRRLA